MPKNKSDSSATCFCDIIRTKGGSETDIYSEIKKKYLEGGITHAQLAQQFGVPVGSIRQRAAREGWKKQRAQCDDPQEQHRRRLSNQLKICDRLLEVISDALEDPDELFGYVECQKQNGEVIFANERLPYINEARVGRLVKALGDIFELQRLALQIPQFKELHDAKCADRKLELELLKIENASDTAPRVSDDGFIRALGLEIASQEECGIDSV